MGVKEYDITVSISLDRLSGYTDQFLAQCWHVAQANPAPYGDRDAGEVVELLAREIIRRWLKHMTPELWAHQGRDHYWQIAQQAGKWTGPNGEWQPNAVIAAANSTEGGTNVR